MIFTWPEHLPDPYPTYVPKTSLTFKWYTRVTQWVRIYIGDYFLSDQWFSPINLNFLPDENRVRRVWVRSKAIPDPYPICTQDQLNYLWMIYESHTIAIWRSVRRLYIWSDGYISSTWRRQFQRKRLQRVLRIQNRVVISKNKKSVSNSSPSSLDGP